MDSPRSGVQRSLQRGDADCAWNWISAVDIVDRGVIHVFDEAKKTTMLSHTGEAWCIRLLRSEATPSDTFMRNALEY